MLNPSRADQSGARAPAAQQTRRSVRRTLPSPVNVHMGPMDSGLLLDISAQGAGLRVIKPLQPGLRLAISFQLPDSDAMFEPTYEVVWATADGRVGLKFLYTAENELRRLRDWLALQLVQAGSVPPEPAALPAVAESQPDLSAIRAPAPHPAAPTEPRRPPVRVGEALSDSVLAQAAQRAKLASSADGAAIALRTGAAVICRATAGEAPELGTEIDARSGLSGECLRTVRVVRCDDATRDPRVDPAVARLLNLRSALVVPIVAADHLAGFVEVLSSRPAAFTAAHLNSLEQIARTIAAELAPTGLGEFVPESPKPLSVAPSAASSVSEPERATTMMALLETELTPAPTLSAVSLPVAPVAAATPFPERVALTEPPVFALQAELEAPGRSRTVFIVGACLVVIAVGIWAANAIWGERSSTAAATPSTASVRDAEPAHSTAPVAKSPRQQPVTEPFPVPAGYMQQRVISNPVPEYPNYPYGRKLGPVVLQVVIGSDGRVTSASYVSGDQLLAKTAIQTIRRWRYQPYLMNGKAIPIITVVTVNFKSDVP